MVVKYGASVKERANEIVNMALGLVASKRVDGPPSSESAALAQEIAEQLNRYPVVSLADYFASKEVSRNLFASAKKFENYGYATAVTTLKRLEPEAKAVVGVLLDFFSLDRKQVL